MDKPIRPDLDEAIRKVKHSQLSQSESLIEWGQSFVGDYDRRHDIKSLHPTDAPIWSRIRSL